MIAGNARGLMVVLVPLVFSISFTSVRAQGLISQIFETAGQTLGVPPLVTLGQNMDAEHKRFKDNNFLYKQAEETTTAVVRLPFSLACTSTFDTVIASVRGACSGFSSTASSIQDEQLLQAAKQRLLSVGVLGPAAFGGVSIKWCNGSFQGAGITPSESDVILNSDLKESSVDDVAVTMAHELRHIQQYRSMGAAEFKCKYAQQYIACGGCQDERHPLENDAYKFEAYASNLLQTHPLADTSFTVHRNPVNSPNSRMAILSGAIAANIVPAAPPQALSPSPSRPEEYPEPEEGAHDACTLSGKLSSPDMDHCIDDMVIIFNDLIDVIDQNFSSDDRHDRQSGDYYLKVSRNDRLSACAILRSTHRDAEIGRIRQETCELKTRHVVYTLLASARSQYPR